jgi:hypothetical protein
MNAFSDIKTIAYRNEQVYVLISDVAARQAAAFFLICGSLDNASLRTASTIPKFNN